MSRPLDDKGQPVNRICFDCDHRWIAKDEADTEPCPLLRCNGIGQPLLPDDRPFFVSLDPELH